MGGLRVLVLVAIFVAFITTSALAVGYERLEVPVNSPQSKTVVTQTTANGSVFQKCPALLDETASLVKDILSQFGLIDKKTP